MTPRLRNLLIGLGISVVIMIADQFGQSSSSGSSKATRKAKTQKPKKTVVQNSVPKASTPKTTTLASVSSSKRRSSRSSQLVGWQRNPFNSVALSSEADVESGSINTEKQQDIEKSILIKSLERYNVEIVAEFNNEKIVLIDRIENDQITFRNGSTTVTRNVGN